MNEHFRGLGVLERPKMFLLFSEIAMNVLQYILKGFTFLNGYFEKFSVQSGTILTQQFCKSRLRWLTEIFFIFTLTFAAAVTINCNARHVS